MILFRIWKVGFNAYPGEGILTTPSASEVKSEMPEPGRQPQGQVKNENYIKKCVGN